MQTYVIPPLCKLIGQPSRKGEVKLERDRPRESAQNTNVDYKAAIRGLNANGSLAPTALRSILFIATNLNLHLQIRQNAEGLVRGRLERGKQ